MKTETAFRYLTANRQANARKFGVFSFKQNGERRSAPSVTDSDEAGALRKCQNMIDANPGKHYIVLPL